MQQRVGRIRRMVSPAGRIATFLLLLAACGKDGPTDPPVSQAVALRFKTQPSDMVAGELLFPAIQVEVLDAKGNPVTNANAEVTLALTGGPSDAASLGTLTARAEGGVATFAGVTLERAGSGYRLKASAAALSTAESMEFKVKPAEATRLAFAMEPANVDEQAVLSPAVEVGVQDRFGNRVVDWTGEVTLALDKNPGGATLSGTLTAIMTNGAARFTDLSLDNYGKGYTLRAQASGFSTAQSTPFDVRLTFATVSAGVYHSCGVTKAGRAYCWGLNSSGTLGDGGGTDRTSVPVAVSGRLIFASVSAGYIHTCGLTAAGKAYCWGNDSVGKLGTGASGSRAEPTEVAGNLTFAMVSAGAFHTCGVTTAGEAYCWGAYGLIGTDGNDNSAVPVAVSGDLTFSTVSAGSLHSCGVTTAGMAYCWGEGGLGRLGTGNQDESRVPVAVAGNLSFASVSAGRTHSCGVTTSGQAYCWGDGTAGQLGTNKSWSTIPVAVSGNLTFAMVGTGEYHSCGLTTAGKAYCWGGSVSGELGNPGATWSDVPLEVSGNLTFTQVSVGVWHSCGPTTGGESYCWGTGEYGRLGTGTTANALGPKVVIGTGR